MLTIPVVVLQEAIQGHPRRSDVSNTQMVVAQNCWLWYMDGWFLQTLVFPLTPNAYIAIANDFSQQLVDKDHTKTMSWKSHKSFSRGPFSHWLWGGEIGSAAAVRQIIFWPLSSRLQCNFNFLVCAAIRQLSDHLDRGWLNGWHDTNSAHAQDLPTQLPRLRVAIFKRISKSCVATPRGPMPTWQHTCWMWCLSSYMILYAQCDCCIGKSWTCNWKIPKSHWSVIDSLEQLPFGLGTEVAEWRWLAHLGFTARLNGWTTMNHYWSYDNTNSWTCWICWHIASWAMEGG